ncbi:glutathione peroxidase [Thiohalospira halophila DSM 15071]|uniref:Glutathione peroxidase n=1 Tax=Thiohalospira halophila DSM 15071 TaxID=1123397 RepID=A0A1I1VNF9_9GAMM|nr:glutathione peroxidase [Thiohalospira halophila]SFD84471.1 glutathione peroxidase [Thiohalospira halophila DSM 15071]
MYHAIRILALVGLVLATPAATAGCPENLDFRLEPLGGGEPVHLCEAYSGKVVLLVNTASKCAYTPQYEGLEGLHADYREQGLVVLGFPSNDFANQEPGSEREIREFCRMTYGVRFPMYAKTHVVEGRAHPLYQRLAAQAGEYPQWNFHKYLLNRRGELVGSFASAVEPRDEELLNAIREAL